jgi:hypothetical protein
MNFYLILLLRNRCSTCLPIVNRFISQVVTRERYSPPNDNHGAIVATLQQTAWFQPTTQRFHPKLALYR